MIIDHPSERIDDRRRISVKCRPAVFVGCSQRGVDRDSPEHLDGLTLSTKFFISEIGLHPSSFLPRTNFALLSSSTWLALVLGHHHHHRQPNEVAINHVANIDTQVTLCVERPLLCRIPQPRRGTQKQHGYSNKRKELHHPAQFCRTQVPRTQRKAPHSFDRDRRDGRPQTRRICTHQETIPIQTHQEQVSLALLDKRSPSRPFVLVSRHHPGNKRLSIALRRA